MSLRSNIEKIYLDNTNYSYPSQAVNQASSLNALSADLYTDSKRFIYELLQNADDSSFNNRGVKVWIKIFEKFLVVAHSGKPFSSRDVQGICSVNNGTKKSDSTKTGYKGIGFKSVFGQSENVTIFSNKEYFRFDSSYSFEWKWEDEKCEWEKENDREFQFPWQIIPIYTETEEIDVTINHFLESIDVNVATIIQMKNEKETTQSVLDLSQNLNMFLFLKNISEINFDVIELVKIEINRDQKDRITLKNCNSSKSDWLTKTINLTVPEEVKSALQDERNIPEKILNTDSIELTLAAKVGNDGISKLSEQESLLYSYLPTDEHKYSLPVLANTSFLTTANRESLHTDSKWNQWLFKTISIEIFRWISILVSSEYSFQAYHLIPKEIRYDELGNKFNEGIKEAIESIPFIITRSGNLAKVKDTIVDFTYLSEKKFIGEEPIRQYIHDEMKSRQSFAKEFVENTPFSFEFKRLGSSYFEWRHLPTFLISRCFLSGHTLDKNIELIKHLKRICELDKIKEITKETLVKLPFIFDHKGHINCPSQICFPTADDQNWDNKNSELSFLHKHLQIWLVKDSETRYWLESLGVQEKTDITYITQTILPKIDSYITHKNAIQTMRDLFGLYRKGNLREDLIRQLSRIRLITQNGSIYAAKDCYLSDYFKPRLEVEKIIDNDIFVAETYCQDILEKDEWKRFFKILGVHEGIGVLQFENKQNRISLVDRGINNKYFETEDKVFVPAFNTFKADCFSNIATMDFIQLTENNYKFALKFWTDFIGNYLPSDIKMPAIGYWGYEGRPGRISGDQVINYVPWFIINIKCIPTITEKCETATSVFINTPEIKSISGKYLPVFNGPELNADWRAFFSFRTSFDLLDYLELLRKISIDVDKNGNIKNDNFKRIKSIYSALLAQCVNWSSSEIEKVKKWAITGRILNTKNQFSKCSTVKYFIDGNESIFQDQYCFIWLSAENRNSPNLEIFLEHLSVQVLRQNEFDLIFDQVEKCTAMVNKLSFILPFLKLWVENENSDIDTIDSLKNNESNLDALEVFQAEELKIAYSGLDFIKNVNIHFDEKSLYVTEPWNSNSVLLNLSDVLCKYFQLTGHERKLDFLLRSSREEIQQYFVQEDIEIPADYLIVDINTTTTQLYDITRNSGVDDFFEDSIPDIRKKSYIKSLIPRAVDNVLNHLNTLTEYNCSSAYVISESVIGGITKNGNDIKVVARPSDNDKVRLFYDSEFDVLEYVDAELWYEDGVTPPKQFTLGQLLKMKKINKIPIKQIRIKDIELNNPKSEILDFDAVPFSPEKTAQTIASFANTNGGVILFGLKEISFYENEIVGLSTDFNVVDITNKAIAMLSPTPNVSFDWLKKGDELVFVIETEKASEDIFLNSQKFIRKSSLTVLDNDEVKRATSIINKSKFKRTIAIIISIENYFPKQRNQIPPVKYANNDAEKFKEMLLNKLSIDEKDIILLENDKAIKTEIEDVIKYQMFSITEEDRLIFYYVGHGFHDGMTNYISTYDMSRTDISNTAISLRKLLLDPLKKSKCKNALIFIDACAQKFIDKYSRNTISNFDDAELIIFSNEFPYYSLFLSCQDGESSYSCDRLKNGIWTYYLTKSITESSEEVILNDQYITDRKLGDYLSFMVSKYAKSEYNWDQNPKTILDSCYENVIIEIT